MTLPIRAASGERVGALRASYELDDVDELLGQVQTTMLGAVLVVDAILLVLLARAPSPGPGEVAPLGAGPRRIKVTRVAMAVLACQSARVVPTRGAPPPSREREWGRRRAMNVAAATHER